MTHWDVRGPATTLPRHGARWELLLDAAAVIAVVAESLRAVSEASAEVLGPLAIAAAAVVLRRRMATTAAALALLASALVMSVPAAAVPVWVLAEVCLFSLPLRRPRLIVLICGSGHTALLYTGALIVYGSGPLDPLALVLPAWTVAVVAAGMLLRTSGDYVRALEERALAAEAFRDSEVRLHLGEERIRIARDLHDSVAHSVSVISVHAGAADRHLDTDTEQARTALDQVRTAARDVLRELQEILTMLRDGDSDSAGAPPPGLEHLSSLVEDAAAAGQEVSLELDDALLMPGAVSAPTSVAAYRILQESLTNARKHGRGAASVQLRRRGTTISIVVRNPVGDAPRGDGFGLLGMEERASTVRGTLRAGREEHEWVVRAELPVQPWQDGRARA